MKKELFVLTAQDLQKPFPIDARELHVKLGSEQQYSIWIKNRIETYEFQENEDYTLTLQATRGRPRKDYHITIDMAKELAMVENTEIGKAIRKYFIQIEKDYIDALNAPIKTSNVTIADVKRELTTTKLRLTIEKRKHRETAKFYENKLKSMEDTHLKRVMTKELDNLSHQLKTQFTQILENDIKMIQQSIDVSVIMMHKKITNYSQTQKQLN